MRITFYILVFISFSSCSIDRGIRTSNGFNFSNKTKFKLKDKCLSNDTTIISMDKQYIFECHDNWITGLQFFQNGRVTSFTFSNTPNSLNRLTTWAGYYCLKEREIEIEMSYDEPLGWTGSQFVTLKIKGEIIGDTLKFKEDKIFGKGRNRGEFTKDKYYKGSCFYYIKSGISLKLNNPDW